MSPKRDALSPTEWSLMHICWRLGEVPARAVHEASLSDRKRAYGTVKTMLERLVEKGYLQRRRLGPLWLYKPASSRTREIARAVDTFVTNVMQNAFSPLIAHFARREKLSPEEIRELKEIIRKSEKG